MGGELATLGGFLMQVEDVIREDAGEWNPGVTVVPCRGDAVGFSACGQVGSERRDVALPWWWRSLVGS